MRAKKQTNKQTGRVGRQRNVSLESLSASLLSIVGHPHEQLPGSFSKARGESVGGLANGCTKRTNLHMLGVFRCGRISFMPIGFFINCDSLLSLVGLFSAIQN